MISATILTLLVASISIIRLSKIKLPKTGANSDELPTISLLIPARNETHAIARSLHNALALDYPKLEIIVLDDQSRDSTSEKIRAFAQDGVRFIQGMPTPEGWVGKNWASHQLAQAASGDYYVFCDIDVLLNSKALTRMLRYIKSHNLACISILPTLTLQNYYDVWAFPILYWLILLLPTRSHEFAPVYGGLMVYDADLYAAYGGYERYKSEVLAEFKIARHFSKRSKYGFFGNSDLDIILLKKPSSLYESRLRYLWPLHQLSPTLSLLYFILTLLPLVVIGVYPLLYGVIAMMFALALYRQVNHWALAVLILPVICLVELGAITQSIWLHWRGGITWKQREIN